MYIKKYKKKNGIKTRDLDTKFLLYDYREGLLMELNGSAKYIWLLIGTKPFEEIISDYSQHYEIDPIMATDDVTNVIENLKTKNFIEEEEELCSS